MGRPMCSINDKIRIEFREALSRGEFSGKCDCGCGGVTEIATATRRNRDGTLLSVAGAPKRRLKGHGVSARKGPDSPFFTGVRYRLGYTYLYSPEHPRAIQGYVPEHVLVMEQELGRFLSYYGFNHKDNEIVHHRDEVRGNNDPSNLQVLTHGEHSSKHRLEDMLKEGFTGFGCHAKGYVKLTKDEAVYMLKEVNSGRLTKTEAATTYGVSRTTVHNYVTGKQALPKH